METAQLLGYDVVIIAQHHEGSLEGAGPDSYFCGGQGTSSYPDLGAVHRPPGDARVLRPAPLYDLDDYPETVPDRDDRRHDHATSQFDGWGYVHLFDAATLEDLDTFAIPEAMDPEFASGFGDLSVHEVATDPLDPSLAYLSYYSGGLRAIEIQCTDPADNSTCELVEVGGYLDPEGNDFWGVEAIPTPTRIRTWRATRC